MPEQIVELDPEVKEFLELLYLFKEKVGFRYTSTALRYLTLTFQYTKEQDDGLKSKIIQYSDNPTADASDLVRALTAEETECMEGEDPRLDNLLVTLKKDEEQNGGYDISPQSETGKTLAMFFARIKEPI